MGETEIKRGSDPEELGAFMRKVLGDLRALEEMLAEGMFETETTRIGAEQEFFLVDRSYRPAPRAMEVLAAIDDRRFTTELAKFNLEANLDPIVLGEHTLSRLEGELDDVVETARRGARAAGAEVVMTGILPTLDKPDLTFDNITPRPRYFAIAEATQRLRGGDFELHIKGLDELTVAHDSVMTEACNAAFQVHFQVEPGSFARLYNIAQALAAPVLAAATNSPLLFGKRLWSETRIAVFRQSVDTRHHPYRRHQQPRVSFGESWIDDSVLEIFREDIARFRLLVSKEVDEDPAAELAAGRVPHLKALCLHNGTVYRWNRPCYGVSEGRPHLRIENRILPAGPTVVDEVANAAFWFGAIKALADAHGDIRRYLDFGAVKENFFAAARLGLRAELRWHGERPIPAEELILSELLPAARSGLRALGIAAGEADRYLDVLQERVASRHTGSRWLLYSLSGMGSDGNPTERLACLTATTVARQKEGQPIHTWPLAELGRDLRRGREKHYSQVGSLMTTDLFTVNENDVIDLVANVMDWKHIRHVPVEDNAHRLVGLVTHRALLRILAQNYGTPMQPIPVRQVMQRSVVTVGPETPTLEAIGLMKQHRISCLPVEEDGRLVGIMTERDLIKISGELLEAFLGEDGGRGPEKRGGAGGDPYSRVEYRRLIAWPKRIRREWPLLEKVLSSGPSRRLLDLGCGTGEHARFLAAQGFEVLGVDASASMLRQARDESLPNPRFAAGDIARLEELTDESFGGAVCLGNTLPHLRTSESLHGLFRGLRRRLVEGAPVVLQLLNYERIFERRERHLPLNFRPHDEGEIVFLRLMETEVERTGEEGAVLFFPTTLKLEPGRDPPVSLASSRRVELRGWRWSELEPALEAAGFHQRELYGAFDGSPFDASASRDLIVVAR
jgi:CBS domain-containing protein/SAM-dependent methyltransferase/gamma-glutamyl:cysteine ligase YbdK (ATP-grasp superfamily)